MRMCLDHAIVNLANACTRLTWRAYVEAVGAIITKFSWKAGQTAFRSRLVRDTDFLQSGTVPLKAGRLDSLL